MKSHLSEASLFVCLLVGDSPVIRLHSGVRERLGCTAVDTREAVSSSSKMLQQAVGQVVDEP